MLQMQISAKQPGAAWPQLKHFTAKERSSEVARRNFNSILIFSSRNFAASLLRGNLRGSLHFADQRQWTKKRWIIMIGQHERTGACWRRGLWSDQRAVSTDEPEFSDPGDCGVRGLEPGGGREGGGGAWRAAGHERR
jgi:hypothetical protein